MTGADDRSQLAGLEWGGATQYRSSGPERPDFAVAGPPRFQRWARDVGHVVGVTPTARRLSIGWSAVQPHGAREWDREALGRCDRTLDLLLEEGLAPCLNLVHMDLPRWADEPGGWLVRDTAERFAEYAAEMGRRFGDRVARWVTVSDIAAPTLADRVAGMFGGDRGKGPAGVAAVHHALLGHGLALRALRGAGATGPAGLTTSLIAAYPATDDPWDRLAAERMEFWGNRLFLDPLLSGRHLVGEDGKSPVGDCGAVRPGDMDVIATPQDFLGVSWHAPHCVTAPENLPHLRDRLNSFRELMDVNRILAQLDFALVPFSDVETTSYGWSIFPESLADGIAGLHDIYGDQLPPLHVTDHGLQDNEILDAHGHPDHGRRRALLEAKLLWLQRIMQSGVEVRGYEYWSVFDNAYWKQRYARLYSGAVGGGALSFTKPTIPQQWVPRFTGALPEPAREPAAPARGERREDPVGSRC
ncbi:family 1 glycosylhydrolase [Streptomyces sp. NPDC044571]|uniref:glycoside hydrolase family 1 protein n=1 Tax=Streptomyces sp. NPDC044571 TaxID=3155371 RepID=UPI0033D75F0E